VTSDVPLIVLDASVAVKWFLAENESGLEAAAALLEDHSAGRARLIAPTLIVHEMLGVFARRLPPELRADAVDGLFDVGIALVEPTRDAAREAALLIGRHQLSAFDAAYAQLAFQLGCDLATADRRLARALDGAVAIRAV
jgi:predicted nucleic acid-binding protein